MYVDGESMNYPLDIAASHKEMPSTAGVGSDDPFLTSQFLKK